MRKKCSISLALRVRNLRQDFPVGVVGNKHRPEHLLFALEVVVQPPKSDPGLCGDLAHGGAMIALLDEQVVRRLQDLRASALSPAGNLFGHSPASNMNERSFIF